MLQKSIFRNQKSNFFETYFLARTLSRPGNPNRIISETLDGPGMICPGFTGTGKVEEIAGSVSKGWDGIGVAAETVPNIGSPGKGPWRLNSSFLFSSPCYVQKIVAFRFILL